VEEKGPITRIANRRVPRGVNLEAPLCGIATPTARRQPEKKASGIANSIELVMITEYKS